MSRQSTKAGPILVAHLFTETRQLLVDLLCSLNESDWLLRTAAPRWSVRDIALHLLGGDLGNLSRRRDAFRLSPAVPIDSLHDLVAFLNELNEKWVQAARGLSPRLLCELLAFTGPQLATYFASLDPFALGEAVSWVGPEPAPVWLDTAREFTEQWHHQQQIRDVTGRPGLYSPRLFAPVLDTLMRGVPRSYRKVGAAEGTLVEVEVTGPAGGR